MEDNEIHNTLLELRKKVYLEAYIKGINDLKNDIWLETSIREGLFEEVENRANLLIEEKKDELS